MRDRLIAIDECMPRDVPSPVDFGALRASDSISNWQEDAVAAVVDHKRVVLCGDVSNIDDIARGISDILIGYASARFALLLHARQARRFKPPLSFLKLFEDVYVATSDEIEPTEVRQIAIWWNPRWVLIPIAEINRGDWIPKYLLPSRQGRVLLMAPKFDADELRLQLEDFYFEHPLIDIVPAPHEWFVPAELGPWKLESRNASRAELIHDSRTHEDYTLTVVVPFRWSGEPLPIEMLAHSLKSITDTFRSNDRCEIVIAVDRSTDRAPLTAKEMQLDWRDFAIVDVVRTSASTDWRAGFIRNCGARFAKNRSGFFLFIDADISIASTLVLSRTFRDSDSKASFDLLQIADSVESHAFQSATSSLLAIRSSLFAQIGGFADAFSHYGCEDNFLVWSAVKVGARLLTFPTSTIEHLRPRLESDDLVAKMIRLRASANLMYRMTLDPAVHAHFFSALGEDLWLRALLKRLTSTPVSRAFLAPFVFLLTFLETRDRLKYLSSFGEVLMWKLKRPVLWFRSNMWKKELVGHAWRANAWKVPNFFATKAGAAKIVVERQVISLRASRGGWNSISWRLKLWSGILIDQIRWRSSVTRIRFAGGCLWLLTGVVSLTGKVSGRLQKFGKVYVAEPIRFLATRPREFWKMHSWRLSKLAGQLRGEMWFFRTPTGWFKVRTPRFYKWVWNPLYKAGSFIRHRTFKRWRNT